VILWLSTTVAHLRGAFEVIEVRASNTNPVDVRAISRASRKRATLFEALSVADDLACRHTEFKSVSSCRPTQY